MRKTIGTNPLDAVVPRLPTPARGGQAVSDVSGRDNSDRDSSGRDDSGSRDDIDNNVRRSASDATGQKAVRRVAKKERLTIHIPVALIERAKNTVFWTPGLTLADLGERALDALVSDLEKQNGGAFETRPHELKGGRPLK